MMSLGQARLYLPDEPFIIHCEDVSILGINLGKEEIISSKYDNRLKGEASRAEVFRISARDDKVIFYV